LAQIIHYNAIVLFAWLFAISYLALTIQLVSKGKEEIIVFDNSSLIYIIAEPISFANAIAKLPNPIPWCFLAIAITMFGKSYFDNIAIIHLF
jgi:hypothetical protein